MGKVFISYSHKDREIVEHLIEQLKAADVSVWWDKELPAGKNWERQIETALADASSIVVVWSKDAVESDEVRAEAFFAKSSNKALPVRIEEVKPPYRYLPLHTIDLLDRPIESSPRLQDLIAAIHNGSPARENAAPAEAEAARPAARGGIVVSPNMLLTTALVFLGLVSGVAGQFITQGDAIWPIAVAGGLGGLGLLNALRTAFTPRSWG